MYQQAGLRELLEEASGRLSAARIPNPRFEAELILAEAAGFSRAQLLAGIVIPNRGAFRRFHTMVERRTAREPLAYILGHKEFYSLELQVGPGVLVPRPETEAVVDSALRFLAGRPNRVVLDVGTGSGAIALAIAANASGVRVHATDISAQAVAIARRNAAAFGLAARVEIIEADCWPPSGRAPAQFDLIVSNPPYVPEADIAQLEPEIACYEPRVALSGGSDGLDYYRQIARELRDHLEQDGAVIVEVGQDQAAQVGAIFKSAGIGQIETFHDLSGIPRVVRGRRTDASPI